jgi:DNA-binding protein HU-beta
LVTQLQNFWRCEKVTKAELVSEVTNAIDGLTKAKAVAAVDAIFHVIQTALSKGKKVKVVGFGAFKTQRRAARKGRNPQNPKEVIDIPAKTVPVFHAGKALKGTVNTDTL